VVTLTKPENRGFATTTAPPDEQLHVLPHYAPAGVDEHGSRQGFYESVNAGGLQILKRSVT
jgi:hypothetical protein